MGKSKWCVSFFVGYTFKKSPAKQNWGNVAIVHKSIKHGLFVCLLVCFTSKLPKSTALVMA